MGRIVVTEFVSLEGVMEDPGGSEDFKYGGWSFEFSRGDEGDKYKLEEAVGSEALFLGRVTYEGFADAWPERDGEFDRVFLETFQLIVLRGQKPRPVLDREAETLKRLMSETGAPCWQPDPPSTGACQVQ